MIEYAESHDEMDPSGIMVLVEDSEVQNKDEIINDLTSLLVETHPNDCSQQLLDNLLETINDEKSRITDEDILENSLEGKSELEQARIIADFRRRKMKK